MASYVGEYDNKWFTWQPMEPGSVPHILPSWDSYTHFEKNCSCCPTDLGDMIVHNSWDGREEFETGRRRPS